MPPLPQLPRAFLAGLAGGVLSAGVIVTAGPDFAGNIKIDWISFVSVSAAIVAAFYVRYQAKEMEKMRQIEEDPQLAVYVIPHEIHFSSVTDIIIANFGRGPAYKVRWKILGDMDELKNKEVYIQNTNLTLGIPILPQGEKIRFSFGPTVKLMEKPTLNPFKINLYYSNERNIEREKEFTIDVRPFLGMKRVGNPPLADIAKDIRSIKETLSSVASPTLATPTRLKIVSATPNEWREWDDRHLEELYAHVKQQYSGDETKSD